MLYRIFFLIFFESFRILELENWEFEKKNEKIFVPISVLQNWNHNLGKSEHCLEIFLAKKSFMKVFLLQLHQKIEEITRVPLLRFFLNENFLQFCDEVVKEKPSKMTFSPKKISRQSSDRHMICFITKWPIFYPSNS